MARGSITEACGRRTKIKDIIIAEAIKPQSIGRGSYGTVPHIAVSAIERFLDHDMNTEDVRIFDNRF